ncbi:hypothetical protein DFH07DRAFT_809138 [Mycena maculata]|uniref:NAD(P)-binding protein n=1 Tax=Mycena maculata TaxID=230809 RepID=A0AAD7NMJ6_9AGAR|nr:hypothetical protein DFH07DRAFT_809138 [Mycena maculata]
MTSPSSSMNLPDGAHSGVPALEEDPLSTNRLFNVEGLVTVITGGGSGIGSMMAAALEKNGATVYIVGRRLDVLQKTAREISKHDKIIPLEGDVTDRDSLLSLVDAVKTRHGYIDLLVNNAGIVRNLFDHPLPSPGDTSPISNPPSPPASPGSPPSAPSIKSFQASLWDSGSPEGFAETFATNVTSVYYTTVAFLDLLHQGNLRKKDQLSFPATGLSHPPYYSSQVLSVSSSGGFRLDAKVLSPSYTLAKSACTHLGKLLANLLAPWGIRSNVLAPGVFPSEMTSGIFPGVGPATFIDSVPLKRAGTEEEMAGAILFLASRSGAYVNGAVWLVDGGRVGSVPSSY